MPRTITTSKDACALNRAFRTTVLLCSIAAPLHVSVADSMVDTYPTSCDYNFELQSRSNEELPRDFHYGVVQIRDSTGRGLGTGYVVNVAHGYIVTARHVVKDFIGKANELRIFNTNFSPSQSITANVVDDLMDDDNALDLALLQSDGDKLRNAGAIALDLQMRTPIETEAVGILGYPENASDNMSANRGYVSWIDRFDRSFSVPDGKDRTERRMEIVVAHNIWAGHSGSPLISKHDVVIGTAKSRVGGREGRYIPASYLLEFVIVMAKAGILGGAERISNILSSPTANVAALASVLQSRITNLELMTWAIRASLEPEVGARAMRFLACPIRKAYTDRKIERAYEFLAAVTPGDQDLAPDVLQAAPE